MEAWQKLAIGGAAVLAALGLSRRAEAKPTPAPSPGGSPPVGPVTYYNDTGRGASSYPKRIANYEAIQVMGDRLSAAGIFGPGFGSYLKAVSYIESRGNPSAGPSTADNAARGAFGLRPSSAYKRDAADVSRAELDAMKDLPWAVAQAAHYAIRLQGYANGTTITPLALRRGWTFPGWVDEPQKFADRPGAMKRWRDALGHFGIPESFSDQPLPILVTRSGSPSLAELRGIALGVEA